MLWKVIKVLLNLDKHPSAPEQAYLKYDANVLGTPIQSQNKKY